MQNGESQIKNLFNADRIFKIPKYQRTYTWQKENLKDFLNDIVNQRGDKPYFLGTFLFHKQINRADYEVIDIVDGQQRLTTIIIFVKVLVQHLNKLSSDKVTRKTYQRYVKDLDGVYKLELENEDDSFLHNYIFDDNETEGKFETPSQKNLYQVKKYFLKALKDFDKEKAEKMYDILTQAKIINYVVNDISDATQIFELLNDRGIRLTNLEGIKSFLMYKISSLKLPDYQQPIKTIQNNFSRIYRIIETYSINENDVLRYHTIAFEDVKTEDYNSPDKYIKGQINKMFDKEVDDLIIKERIINYVSNLKQSFEIYKSLKINETKSSNLDKFKMIGRVSPFYPFLMIVYKNDKIRLNEFLDTLNNFTFRAAFIKLQNKNESFYKEIRNKNNLFKTFKEPINGNWWNMNKRVDDDIEDKNYYHWKSKNIVKYILFEYENHLRHQKGYPLLTIENYFETDTRSKFSIEHITAQKSDLEFDESFNNDYLHSLGNLVIDTTSSNSRKGKKGVDDKLEEYTKAPLMSQNEIKQNTKINWNNLEDVKSFIENRDILLQSFIKTEILKNIIK